MKIYNSLSEFSTTQKTVATLGTFDGVHIGHRKIIDRLVTFANNEQCDSIILTFFPIGSSLFVIPFAAFAVGLVAVERLVGAG